MKVRFGGLAACLLLLARASLALPLWELEGARGQVRLMGSIHVLRASDYPLPGPMERAYADADVLVMEIDMDDLDDMQAQALTLQLGIDPQGRNLATLIGARDFARVEKGMAEIDVPVAIIANTEPWFAALMVTQMRLLQLGLDPNLGLEKQWAERARRDGKEVLGLETLEYQLGVLDSMPLQAQKLFLLSTIDEAAHADEMIETTLQAWRSGDLQTLEMETTAALSDQPQLYRKLLVDRNRNWTTKIREMARDGGNYLVVVGSAHLLGKDSVLVMLDRAGYPSHRITQ